MYDAVAAYAQSLGDDVVVGPRKTFSGFSRQYQFAAARPVRATVRLGLAIDPTAFNLEPAKKSDSWSDRLTSVVIITSIDEIDKTLKRLLKQAYENS